MKKLLLILGLTLSVAVQAQHKPFQFGFKAGANLGWFNSNADNYVNKGAHLGGAWGFVADIYMMENYSFTTGFDVLFLNGKLEYPDAITLEANNELTPGVMTRKYKAKYIEIPLVFTMKTNEIKGLRYYGQIGFGLAFRLSAKGDDSFLPGNSDNVESKTHDVTGDTRFSRESLILGAGIEIPLQGDTYVRTGIKYDNAFINVLSGDNGVNPDEKNNARNNFIELNLAILF